MPNPLISKSALFPGPIPFKLGRFYHTLSFWHSTPSRCWDKFTQLCLCQITQVKEILVALAMGEARSKPCGQYGQLELIDFLLVFRHPVCSRSQLTQDKLCQEGSFILTCVGRGVMCAQQRALHIKLSLKEVYASERGPFFLDPEQWKTKGSSQSNEKKFNKIALPQLPPCCIIF